MDTKRIEVLHVADRDAVVLGISYYLVLDLLPALHASLNQHLRARLERFGAEGEELGLVVGKPTPKSTKCICSTNNDGKANARHHAHGFLDAAGRGRLGALFTNGLHTPGEKLAVFGRDDGVNGSAQDFDAKCFKLIFELNPDLEGRLTSKGNVYRVWSLVDDHFANE